MHSAKQQVVFTLEMFSFEDKAEILSSVNLRIYLIATRRSDELFGPHGKNRVNMKEITMVLLWKCVTSHYNLQSSKAAPSPSSSAFTCYLLWSSSVFYTLDFLVEK